VIAAVLAGGALAAAGQTALSQAVPAATDGANMLKVGVQELLSTDPVEVAVAAAPVTPLVLLPDVATPTAEPAVVGVADLVKAADRQSRVVPPRSTTPPARDTGAPAARSTDVAGGVQMVAGRVSSGFGGRWGRSHNGIDIAAPIGTPIRTPLSGEVVASGPASGFGLWVRVRHDDGTVTTYGHVNRSLVRVGEQVSAGEEIAEVGNRGRSTGPHLHMEVQTPGGTTVNPRPWLDGHGIGY
jgi:murein DD-endopeptidase MepM/ murein hydrolase activator NlpD